MIEGGPINEIISSSARLQIIELGQLSYRTATKPAEFGSHNP